MTKLKTCPNWQDFADDNLKVSIRRGFFFKVKVENIVGKGENAGFQHFLLFPQYFQGLLCKGHKIMVKDLLNLSNWFTHQTNRFNDKHIQVMNKILSCNLSTQGGHVMLVNLCFFP